MRRLCRERTLPGALMAPPAASAPCRTPPAASAPCRAAASVLCRTPPAASAPCRTPPGPRGMPCLFPHVSGCIFPITCIVTYRTCIVAVSNVYPQLYPSSKCVFDTLRYTIDTKSRLWWGLSSVSSSGYRANFGDFCIVHVSCMYREISKKVYRTLYRYMYRAYF